MIERCFACDHKINNPNDSKHRPYLAYTSDGQRVYVGRECFHSILYWNDRGGYYPPKGGPPLFAKRPIEKSELERQG